MDKRTPTPPLPASAEEALETIRILRAELAAVCVAVGRSKDGTGYDVDWFELHKDVKAHHSEIAPCMVCGQRRIACGENTACPGRMPR